jgi:cytidylate kinase
MQYGIHLCDTGVVLRAAAYRNWKQNIKLQKQESDSLEKEIQERSREQSRTRGGMNVFPFNALCQRTLYQTFAY